MRRLPKMPLALTAFDTRKCTMAAFQPQQHPQRISRTGMTTLPSQYTSFVGFGVRRGINLSFGRLVSTNIETLDTKVEKLNIKIGTESESMEDIFAKLDWKIGSMQTELKEVDRKIGGMQTEVKEEIGSMQTEVKEEIGRMQTELKAVIGSMKTELKEDIDTKSENLDTKLESMKTELKEVIGSMNTKPKGPFLTMVVLAMVEGVWSVPGIVVLWSVLTFVGSLVYGH
jgi:hypothetical protein